MMFGIGPTEILVILVVALIVLGPKNLPKIARTLGKGMGEFRRVSTEFQRTINTEIEVEERTVRKKEAERRLAERKAQEERSAEPASEPQETAEPELAVAPEPDGGNVAASASEDAPVQEGKKA